MKKKIGFRIIVGSMLLVSLSFGGDKARYSGWNDSLTPETVHDLIFAMDMGAVIQARIDLLFFFKNDRFYDYGRDFTSNERRTSYDPKYDSQNSWYGDDAETDRTVFDRFSKRVDAEIARSGEDMQTFLERSKNQKLDKEIINKGKRLFKKTVDTLKEMRLGVQLVLGPEFAPEGSYLRRNIELVHKLSELLPNVRTWSLFRNPSFHWQSYHAVRVMRLVPGIETKRYPLILREFLKKDMETKFTRDLTINPTWEPMKLDVRDREILNDLVAKIGESKNYIRPGLCDAIKNLVR